MKGLFKPSTIIAALIVVSIVISIVIISSLNNIEYTLLTRE